MPDPKTYADEDYGLLTAWEWEMLYADAEEDDDME